VLGSTSWTVAVLQGGAPLGRACAVPSLSNSMTSLDVSDNFDWRQWAEKINEEYRDQGVTWMGIPGLVVAVLTEENA